MSIGQAAYLNNKEWSRLEKVTSNSTHKVIWALLRFTGARINEVLSLKVKDVYSEVNEVKDVITYRKENRKGKDKNHAVPVSSMLRGYLENFRHSDQGYLFPSPRNPKNHLSYEAALKFLQSAASVAGLGTKKVSTHSGRRSCLTELSRLTDLRTVQAISGHSNLQNLQRYLETDPNRTRTALDSIFV